MINESFIEEEKIDPATYSGRCGKNPSLKKNLMNLMKIGRMMWMKNGSLILKTPDTEEVEEEDEDWDEEYWDDDDDVEEWEESEEDWLEGSPEWEGDNDWE